MRWVASVWLVVVAASEFAADMHHAEPTALVQGEFEAAWRDADTRLRREEL